MFLVRECKPVMAQMRPRLVPRLRLLRSLLESIPRGSLVDISIACSGYLVERIVVTKVTLIVDLEVVR